MKRIFFAICLSALVVFPVYGDYRAFYGGGAGSSGTAVEASTAAGQLLFGDATTGWDHTETSELFWNDTTKVLGLGTATPRRRLDVLDATNPQLRLTHTDNSVYTDFQTDSNGYLTLTPTGGSVVFPQGSEANPAIAFGDGDSGFYEGADDFLYFVTGGANRMLLTSGGFGATLTTSFSLRFLDATATAPVFAIGDDLNTGVGANGADQLSLISGGVEGMRIVEDTTISIHIPETATPTAVANYGSIYPKTDNNLYFQDGAGTEHEVKMLDSYFGSFYAYEKAIPMNITVADTYHAVHLVTAGDIVTGVLSGFTFDAGRAVDADITSEASGTGGLLRIVCSAAHGLTTGQLVVLGNMNDAGHNLPTRITTDGTNPTTEFLCDDINYVAGAGASAGIVDKPACLIAGTGSGGYYNAAMKINGTAGSPAKVWKFEANVNVTPCDNVVSERLSTNTIADMVAVGHIAIAAGDCIWISGENVTDTSDYSIKHLNLSLNRL